MPQTYDRLLFTELEKADSYYEASRICNKILTNYGVERTIYQLPFIIESISDAEGRTPNSPLGAQRLWAYICRKLEPESVHVARLSAEDRQRLLWEECFEEQPDCDLIRRLVEAGADMNLPTGWYNTAPVNHLSQQVKDETLEWLLQRGANVNLGRVHPKYPHMQHTSFFHRVLEKGPVKRVRLLLRYGADVRIRDVKQNTALHLHSYTDSVDPEAIQDLLAAGAEVNTQNEEGQTPLHMCCTFRAEEKKTQKAAEVLLHHGADALIQDKQGNTPLHILADNGYGGNAIDLLLRYGADINARNAAGETPMIVAVKSTTYQNRSLMLLLEAGADPNSGDDDGNVPLHHALIRRQMEFVKALLPKTDPKLRNRENQTPYEMALDRGLLELAKIFKEDTVKDYEQQTGFEDLKKVKEEILAEMKKGGFYATSHHEGGTRFEYVGEGRYKCTEYGEMESVSYYNSDEEALRYLRQACEWRSDDKSELGIYKYVLEMVRA